MKAMGWPLKSRPVELNSAPDGSWRLQYVSHPAQSGGLTASIALCTSDFVTFIQMRKVMRLPHALTEDKFAGVSGAPKEDAAGVKDVDARQEKKPAVSGETSRLD